MHIRLRTFDKPTDTIIVVESKLTKIEAFRKIVHAKLGVEPKSQRLFYGGKLLENSYTFHDYSIKMNDVIQLMTFKNSQSTGSTQVNKDSSNKDKISSAEKEKEENSYEDAVSTIFSVGDLVDVRNEELGSWFEGKIVRIVSNPAAQVKDENTPSNSITSDSNPEELKTDKYIDDYKLLYKVQLDDDGEEDSKLYSELQDIRPRARREIALEKIVIGQTYMVNHNTEDPLEKGHWFDFKVSEVIKHRKSYELEGTLYIGAEAIPQKTTIKVHDKIFAIEQPVPLKERTDEIKKLMTTAPAKRSAPLNCLTCRDDEDAPCKDCGCYLCSSKESPDKIVLCDECNSGYHMACLSPPLTELPEEDWYCPSCKRDPTDVVAPGASKQAKKSTASKTTRDWGRGMACVGKTKACSMSLSHFGSIPGIEVGMCWRFRIQLSESGVHRPPVSGIHGREADGAYSIVLSGGYEDDVDNGNEFTYTGSGGRDLSGNKRTAEQSCDQTLTRENKALARNCAVKQINPEGADAGDNWKEGRPVRVVRSCKMLKHFPKYAPKEGIRYDGLYKVVKYYPEKGLSGFRVWKYLLRRDDPSPAPWEKGAAVYPVIYPDGYLEAEEEKRKASKRPLSDISVEEPKAKKKAMGSAGKENKKKGKKAKLDLPSMFKMKATNSSLTDEERNAIKGDTVNKALWDECLAVLKAKGKIDFVERVREAFLCIICQDVVSKPVNTPCHHLFCMSCLNMAFKIGKVQVCPHCRGCLRNHNPEVNEQLKTALGTIMPGYDVGRK